MDPKFEKISAYELFRGCFGLKSLKNVRAGKTLNGVYILRVTYQCAGSQHGQVIWFLYNPRDPEVINFLLQEVLEKFSEWDGKAIGIEIDDPNVIALPIDVLMFSDGVASVHYASRIQLKTDVGGFVGVIVGQGRALNFDDLDIGWVMHVVLANFLGAFFRELADDPFIAAGFRKLERVKSILKERGFEPKSIKIGRGGEVGE